MTAETLDTGEELQPLQAALSARFERLRTSVRRGFVAEAAARVLFTVLALVAVTFAVDWWLELSRPARWCLAAAAAAVLAATVWRFLIVPWRIELGPVELASALDRARRANGGSNLAPHVASVLELPGYLSSSAGFSAEMIQEAVRRNFRRLEQIDFSTMISRRHLAVSLATACLALVPLITVPLFAPATAQVWAARWLLGSNRPWPRDTSLEVVGLEDGRLLVPRGEPGRLQVLVSTDKRNIDTVSMQIWHEDGKRDSFSLTRFSDGDFRHELSPLQHPARAEIRAGDATADFQIVPIDRPRIAGLSLTARHPRDGEPTVSRFTGEEGNIRLLPRTEALLEVIANVPVSAMRVESEIPEMRRWEQVDDRRFVTRWTHTQPVELQVSLVAAEGGLVSHPRPVSIGVKTDRPPHPALQFSGVRQRVTPNALVPLTATGRDDYGVRTLSLLIEMPASASTEHLEPQDERSAPSRPEVEPEQQAGSADGADPVAPQSEEDDAPQSGTPQENEAGESAPLSAEKAGEPAARSTLVYGPADPAVEQSVQASQELDLEPLALVPGRILTLQAAAEDDCYTGRQSVLSRKLVFRVVSPEELFREILLRQQQLRARLRKTTDQAEGLAESLRSSVLPDDATMLLRTHQLIRRDVGRVHRELEASVVEMKLNRLGGQEAHQLITQTVLQPLGRLHDVDLEAQRRALDSLSTERPEPFEEITARQQSIVDSLRRILDNMAQWDSFIDVVNQLNAVIELEQRVQRKTDELRKTQVESIFDE